MEKVTRTVYGAALHSSLSLGKQHSTPANTTLNEKFNVFAQPPVALDPNALPAIKFLVIGNGGHRAIVAADGFPTIMPNVHNPKDAACFNHLPFIMRPVGADLTTAQRAGYALRRIEVHDGVSYVAYYAKRMDHSSVSVAMQESTWDGTTRTTVPFVPTSDNLNPIPYETQLGVDQLIESTTDYVSGSGIITIGMTINDVEELRNVSQIIYGDTKHAVISEIGYVGAIDMVVTDPNGGGFTYAEAIKAQIVVFMSRYHDLNTTDGFTETIDLGVTEPLFAVP